MRLGHGLEQQFFATDDEVAALIKSAVAADPWVYRVIATEIVDDRPPVRREVFTCDITRVIECGRPRATLLWLVADEMTDTRHWTGDSLDHEASVSGLVMVDHGFKNGHRTEASRVAIVNRVRDMATREERENSTYLPLFRRLRREIKRIAVWSSVRKFQDGTLHEDDAVEPMTDGAAEAATRDPEAWAAHPGRRLVAPDRT